MADVPATADVAPGRFAAVGVGPGDPELLTLKGVRVLREADVVITPVGDRSDGSIACSIVAAHLDPDRQQVLQRVFPMRQPEEEMARAWREVAGEVAALVRAGKNVAFVTLGDPMLYSTFLYLRQELEETFPDVKISTVPGISSIFAAAGKADLALGIGEDILTVVPATLPDRALRAALRAHGTIVLLKVNRHFDRVRSLLQGAGLERQAIFVRRLGLEGEKLVAGLDNVAPDDLDYLSLILVRRENADG